MPSKASNHITLLDVRSALGAALRPDPDLTVSQWADEHRRLTSMSAGEPGKWRTSRTPYLREIMDCLSPLSPYSRVVFEKPAQVGGSEVLLNFLGYIIHRAAGPVMLVEPTVELGKRFSRQRIDSLIENTPVLAERVSDPRERDAANTMMSKEFPGGVLVITGANSATGLRSMPARYLLMDELSAYPASASSGAAGTDEGDPADLAIARTGTFANRKIAMVSTPSTEGTCRIDQAYRESDQRKYHVPCPHCGAFQILRWSHVKWPDGKPGQAYYECDHCQGHIADHQKPPMLERGEWRAEATGDGDTAGFWINGLYSPWTTWGRLAKDFLRSRKSPERLQAFVNSVLAETFQQAGATKTPSHELMARREPYNPGEMLPAGVCIITIGVDVQADRLEMEIVGWGRDEESWSLAYVVLPGDTAKPEVWAMLEQALAVTFDHPCGREMNIAAACIDAGYQQSKVTQFCLERAGRKVYATKGSAGQHPIWPRMPTKAKRDRRPLWIVGVDAAKEATYARLRIAEPGPGFCHFPISDQHDLGYFDQLTSETCKIRYHKGFAHREWVKQPGARNEALDARCYAYAALQSLVAQGFRINRQADIVDGKAQVPAPQSPRQQANDDGRRPWIDRRDRR